MPKENKFYYKYRKKSYSLYKYFNVLSILRVLLHVTKTKSHPRIKKILFTRQDRSGIKQVEFHS